ncbi:hypothetical protein WB881_003493 [Vibrio parahaemolyticus]|nr:hypothetical protein [Vibrio parahaemolyticus]HCE4679041.1 hypothetical protein [Vibrio parahaemolyticus]HCG5126657.1 hypothetical protein [Vibrio parahaemolyticus]
MEMLNNVVSIENTIDKVDAQTLKLANEIKFEINKLLGVTESESVDWLDIPIDYLALHNQLKGSFYSSVNRRIYLVNEDGSLIQFDASEAISALTRRYGAAIDDLKLEDIVEDRVRRITNGNAERKSLLKKISEVPSKSLISFIKYYSQRDKISIEVDIFAEDSYIRLTPDSAIIRFNHIPYECKVSENNLIDDIISDYKMHFPELDDLLKLIVASRFARDRKKCYLWLKCQSDWGKGFLSGVLSELGLVVHTSVNEIERMMSGAPVAKDYPAFKRALILWIDEFKSIKSEVKELCSSINISPKNQLSVTVPLYTKLFTSDEGVSSMANEYGIEDQFANRFSLIEVDGNIEKRSKWLEVGKAVYADNVGSYAANTINKMIDELRALGEIEASIEADKIIAEFVSKYGIDKKFSRLSSSLDMVVSEISSYIYERYKSHPSAMKIEGYIYLRSASKEVGNIITDIFDKSMAGTYIKKKDQIIKKLSLSGEGVKVVKIDGTTVRAVIVRKPEDFDFNLPPESSEPPC